MNTPPDPQKPEFFNEDEASAAKAILAGIPTEAAKADGAANALHLAQAYDALVLASNRRITNRLDQIMTRAKHQQEIEAAVAYATQPSTKA